MVFLGLTLRLKGEVTLVNVAPSEKTKVAGPGGVKVAVKVEEWPNLIVVGFAARFIESIFATMGVFKLNSEVSPGPPGGVVELRLVAVALTNPVKDPGMTIVPLSPGATGDTAPRNVCPSV